MGGHRVLVCGGRSYGEMPSWARFGTFEYIGQQRRVAAERTALNAALDALRPKPTVLLHGKARGADRLADMWARANGIEPLPFPADWYPNGFGQLDKGAGPRRNQRMIDEGKPDLVIAFPGGSGTADMVRRARKAGIEIIEVQP